MAFQAHPSVVPLLFASTLLWANAGYLLWRRRGGERAPGQSLAAGLVASFAVSVGAFALEQAHTGLGAKVFWNQVQYVGDAPLTAFLLGYVLVYLGYDPSRRAYAVLFALPALVLGTVFTSPFHGLFWSSVSLGEIAGYAVLDNGAGPLFYVYILYTYAYLLVALALLARAGVDAKGAHRRHVLALSLGAVLPALAGVAYVLELGPAPTPNYPGYAYVVTAAAITYSIHRHDVFTVVPVARRTVFEGIDVGVITLDSRGLVAGVNGMAADVLDRAESDLVGRPGSDVLGPLVADIDVASDDPAEATVETDERVFDVSVRPLARSGTVIGRAVVVSDVTDRHRREQRLEEVNTRLELALEGTDTGVWEWDPGTGEVSLDATAEGLVGYDPGEFPGTYEGFLDRIDPEDREAVERRLERVVETGGTYRAEFRVRLPDGDRHWIQSRGVVEGDGDGDSARVIGVQIDVTERKQFERSLEDRNRKLEMLNRIVRHDIRNDIDVVLGYASRLSEAIDDPEAQNTLDGMIESGKHVVEVTEIVRDLMATMGEETVTEPVNLAVVLRSELDALDRRSGDVVVDAPDRLPDRWVVGDAMLGTVFRNVLTNAVRHNDADRPAVSVSVAETAEEITVRVADNGPGVTDDRKEEIFGRGEKGLESPGTGVGLYLVDRLVAGYGGDVWVEDRDGPGGAVFVVELPRAVGATVPPTAATD